jgi:hypothetical protein
MAVPGLGSPILWICATELANLRAQISLSDHIISFRLCMTIVLHSLHVMYIHSPK